MKQGLGLIVTKCGVCKNSLKGCSLLFGFVAFKPDNNI